MINAYENGCVRCSSIINRFLFFPKRHGIRLKITDISVNLTTQCNEVQNACKTPVENKYGKFCSINIVHCAVFFVHYIIL